ncbi:MAG: hypothetical protein ABFD07_11355, partial [Methanobacterium sp.]
MDIAGDLNDLVGVPLLMAEEVTNEQNVNPDGVIAPEYQESFTWTFYKLATIKGSVTLSWYGESNGYYNELVSFKTQSITKLEKSKEALKQQIVTMQAEIDRLKADKRELVETLDTILQICHDYPLSCRARVIEKA